MLDGEHACVDAAGDESWETIDMMRRFLPVAARWERGSFSKCCLVPLAVRDNDCRNCNGLCGIIRLPGTGVGRASSVALFIVRCRALGVARNGL